MKHPPTQENRVRELPPVPLVDHVPRKLTLSPILERSIVPLYGFQVVPPSLLYSRSLEFDTVMRQPLLSLHSKVSGSG